jgi:glycerol-3-phosphate dehydrogenase (NAD(P)+)
MHHALVLGGGSFGTALAQVLARRDVRVTLWVRSAEVATAINASRRNPHYLSQFELHPHIWATADLHAACGTCDTLVSGLPSSALRAVLQAAAPALSMPRVCIIGTKGIEPDSLMTMDEVTTDVLGIAWQPYVVALSGPSFAHEMMLEHPTAVVLACRQVDRAAALARQLFSTVFRPYSSGDVVGVEMGGALKNVMALAAGALVGLGYGDNSRAAMITRGIAEMSRLAIAKGGSPLTLMGLAGVGDLVLTCTGGLSRNRAVGEAIGRGLCVDAACRSVGQVAEGIRTTAAAHALAQKLGVEAPIIQAVYRVLFEGLPVKQAVGEVMQRVPGHETDGQGQA